MDNDEQQGGTICRHRNNEVTFTLMTFKLPSSQELVGKLPIKLSFVQTSISGGHVRKGHFNK